MKKEIDNRISYLGPKGTYSEQAALLHKNQKENLIVPKKNLFQVLESVEKKRNSEGIIPIENSRVGTIIEVIDYLIKSKNLFLNEEILKLGSDAFEYEILKFCETKRELGYVETMYQFKEDVLDAEFLNGTRKYYNSNIMNRWFSKSNKGE